MNCWKIIFSNILLIIFCTGCKNESTQPVNSEGEPQKFKEFLVNENYIVQEGELTKMDVFQLVDNGILQTCLGNNSSSPYKACKLPPAPGQSVNDPFTEPSGRSMEYHLRPDEAIVFILKTPPEATYFSYQTFLAKIQNGSARKRIWVALGDTYNNFNIATAATPYGQSGKPFESNTIIIVTADKNMDKKMRTAAMAAGYSEAIINTEVISHEKLKMGTGQDDDTFVMLHRMNHFKNETVGQNYFDNPSGVVYRVTADSVLAPDYFPSPILKQRGSGTTEFYLENSMNDLRKAILNKYSNLKATELNTGFWFNCYECDQVQRETDCIGATRDALYLGSDNFVLDNKENEFLIVYGINHTATGKATYNNFVFNGVRLLNGVASVQNYSFQGSAAEYLPNHPDKDKMYAWKLTRSISDTGYVTSIPWGIKSHGVELEDSAFVAFRLYVEPQTEVGPDPQEIIFDRVIKFEPKE